MRYAFTGTRSLTHEDELKVAEIVSGLPEDSEVITGACIGVDALVARIAYRRGLRVHTVVPANLKQVDPDWKEWCHSHELMPKGGKEPYRERNTRMVELCDVLIGIAGYPEDHPKSIRSGTWMTIRIARKKGKTRKITILNPEE